MKLIDLLNDIHKGYIPKYFVLIVNENNLRFFLSTNGNYYLQGTNKSLNEIINILDYLDNDIIVEFKVNKKK